jgi:hypothetical protein
LVDGSETVYCIPELRILKGCSWPRAARSLICSDIAAPTLSFQRGDAYLQVPLTLCVTMLALSTG